MNTKQKAAQAMKTGATMANSMLKHAQAKQEGGDNPLLYMLKVAEDMPAAEAEAEEPEAGSEETAEYGAPEGGELPPEAVDQVAAEEAAAELPQGAEAEQVLVALAEQFKEWLMQNPEVAQQLVEAARAE